MKTTVATLRAALLFACAVIPARTTAQTGRPQVIPKSGALSLSPALEERMRSEVKVPAGFDLTLFAGPPVAMYPACISEAPDGAVFVCVDPNLSLSTMKGVGRIMRLVDADGDGHADSYTTFAEMDSPRGVVTDGRTVFVMHPPMLTAYRDTDGDGIADESTDIVTGLGFDLEFRGADHTTNNIQLGPDGWLYVAVGDYGFIRATGTDGRQIQHRGGAVVRVRPDGTGLEIVAVGTRNIFDVALDPFAHVFARDNTNDGDGWDTRLHYLAPGANMGYPMLYQNFRSEHFPSLADYGAGAGVGAVWLEDPAWPAPLSNALYTGDWTLQKIYRHVLTPRGAIWDITQDEFLSVPHPSDIAVDGSSNLYVSSLAGGQFNYIGDSVGYVARVRPSGAGAREPRVAGASDAQLFTMLASGNAIHRLHAQQELLRRGANDTRLRTLRATLADAGKSAEARVAAAFTLKQLAGVGATDALMSAATAGDAHVREAALRMLADRTDQLQGVTSGVFFGALRDADAQVRVEAIRGLVRIGARDAGAALVQVAGGGDQGLSHLAINALVSLGERDAALAGVDGSEEVRTASLRALAMMYEPATVTGLLDRLARAKDAPMRLSLLHTLARLHNREGYWRGDWWTTRPAHLGPYFDPAPWEQSPRIRAALVSALAAASGDELAVIARDFAANQVLPRGGASLIVAIPTSEPLRAAAIDAMTGHSQMDAATLAVAARLDGKGPALHAAVAQLLAGESSLPATALLTAKAAALDAAIDATTRGTLLTSMLQMPGQAALEASADAMSQLTPAPEPPPAGVADPVQAAWRRFVGDRRRLNELDYFIKMAHSGTPAQRTLAYAVLVQSVRAPRTAAGVREKVAPVIDSAWTDAASAPSLVRAINVMHLETQYTEKLAAYNLNRPK